ncbi:MAG TPA: phage tail tape measure protein, partial [Psychromonas sp.]
VNAYGSDVLSAADATDVMVSAVREGKLEADELAQSMGRVLPVASAMGVRFDEVGAAFAALSRTGTNAAEAATQVRGILTSLLKPTTDAQKALAEMGLSTQGLRQEIKEKGLLSALETLKTNFDGNDEAAQRVFGNVRALSGIMDLLGANVQTTRDIFDSMTESAGTTAKAFEATSESASFKLTKALNEAKVAFTEMGAVILTEVLPLIQDLSRIIVDLFRDFSSLDENTKKFILTLGGIVVVAPTVISAIGGITTAVAGLTKALVGLSAAKFAKPLALLSAFLSLGGDERRNDFLVQLEIDINAFESEELLRKAEETAAAVDLIQASFSKPIGGAAQTGGVATSPVKQLIDDFDELQIALFKADETAKEIDLDTRFDLAAASASVEFFGNVVKSTADSVRQPFENIQEQMRSLSDTAKAFLNQVNISLQNAFMSMMQGENAMQSLGKAIMDLIKRLIAAAAAAAIVAAIISRITGVPFAPTFKAVFSAGTGISMGEGGAAPGANSFFPDPQDRSSSVNLTGQFRLDGQDLVLAVERANNVRGSFI